MKTSLKSTYVKTGKRLSGLILFISVAVVQVAAQTVSQSIPGPICVGATTQFVYQGGCPSGDISWSLDGDLNGTVSSAGVNLANATWTSASTHTAVVAHCNSNSSLTGATSWLTVYASGGTASVSIAGSSTAIAGDNLIFTATPVNGGTAPTYYWKVNGNIMQSGSSSTYSTTQLLNNDVVSLTMSSNKPCLDGSSIPNSNSITVTIYPVPTVSSSGGINYLSYGSTLQLSTGSYYSYQWTKGGINISGATQPNLSVTQVGVYAVKVKGWSTGPERTSPDFTVYEGGVSSQPDQNYISTVTFLKEGIGAQPLYNLSSNDYSQSTTYFDGFGRPIQNVVTMASPLKKDLVQPIVYDAFGREHRKYLPFVPNENSGRYKSDVINSSTGAYQNAAFNFYNNSNDKIADDPKPYSEMIFEPSPVNRVVKQGAQGEAWQPDNDYSYGSPDHTIKKGYESNIVNEVLLFKYIPPTSSYPLGFLSISDYYLADQLYKSKTKDEDQNEVIEFTNKQGRLILKKEQVDATTYALTQYIYDDFGNLVSELQPEATKSILTRVALPSVTWASVSGLSVGSGNLLTKTASASYTNGVAVSSEVLNAGLDGWVEMVAEETNKSRMIGLSYSNMIGTSINYAIELRSDSHIYVWENGVSGSDLGTYSNGTKVRVSREGIQVKYYVDGVLRQTSASSSTLGTSNMIVDLSIYHTGGTIKNAKISFSANSVIQNALNNFAFRFTYDARNRMTQKVAPGAAAVYMVYDNRNRLVLTQDGNQRATATKYWTFTKYDELNRPILTGIKDTTVTITRDQMQAAVNAHYLKSWAKWGETFVGGSQNVHHGYSDKSYPVVSISNNTSLTRYLTVTYYDDYTFKNILKDSASYSFKTTELPGEQVTSYYKRVNGQITGTKVKVLDGKIEDAFAGSGGFTWLKTVNYYDDKSYVIQIASDNYKADIDRITNVYDFPGKVLKTKTTHIDSDVTWKDLVGTTVTGNKLYKATTDLGWNAGAVSKEQLLQGVDGWLEITASEPQVAPGSISRAIGLSDQNTDASLNTIDYGFNLSNNWLLEVYENGVSKRSGGYQPGDLLKIQRTGTTIKYYQNNVLFYTSTVSSNTALMADASVYDGNGTIVNTRASFSTISRSITKKFEYDHANRLVRTWHQVNSGPDILLSKNEYNEIGQLIDKKLHSTNVDATDFKQSVDYGYNIRGWLASINNASLGNDPANEASDYFGFELGYNTDIGITNPQLYNGNISAIKWSNNLGLTDIKQVAYSYNYDKLNRFTGATFKQYSGTPLTWTVPTGNSYSESGYTYDLNGNIKSLTRKGQNGLSMDILTYDYGIDASQSNKLLKVTDSGDDGVGFLEQFNSTSDDYLYDANGNLLWDRNKGGTDALVNGSFENGNTGWTISDPSNRLSFVNGSAQIAAGASTTTISQSNVIQPTLQYVVVIDWERTASTAGIVINVGGTNITASTPGISTLTVTAGSTQGVTVTPNGNTFAGKINSIQVKGLTTISYNILFNQPEKVYKGLDWIHNIYDGTGRVLNRGLYGAVKALKKKSDYAGEFFYENDTLRFITHREGRVIMTGAVPEYQYNLRDIWGNVRLTFTTKSEAPEDLATYEEANVSAEQSKFLRYGTARRVQSSLFDKTNGSSTGYSERLNGSTNEKFGLAKSLSVMPGDTIKMEVYAKYVDQNNTNWTQALTDFLAAVANGTAPPGTVVDGASYATSTSSFSYAGLLNTSGSSGNGPKAYLNWLIFDRNYVFLNGGFQRMSDTAKEQGQDVAHEKLSASVLITQPGYVYVYLSNEETTPVEVYFDEFKVRHAKSSIIQMDDYYALGLTFNSYKREGSLENRVKFQGQERITDLDLNWDAFRYRNYMPEIGRFFNIDPLADKYVYNSPYAFAENKLGQGIELEGKELLPFVAASRAGWATRIGRVLEESHHIIPRQFKLDKIIQQARKDGFKFEGKENKIELEKFSKETGLGRHGSHPKYNEHVGKALEQFKERNPNPSPGSAGKFVRDLANDLTETIKNNPETKVNDLFKPTSTGTAGQVEMQSDGTRSSGPSPAQQFEMREGNRYQKELIQGLENFYNSQDKAQEQMRKQII